MDELFERFAEAMNETDKMPDSQIILDKVRKYNVYDFLSKVSALNMLPFNQNKSLIFDSIICAILQNDLGEFKSEINIGNKKFKDIINNTMNMPLAYGIDPPEEPFIYRILFYGNKWVFPGVNTSCGYNLQNIIDLLFKHHNKYNKEFIKKCSIMTELVLHITTNAALKLGYDINTLKHYEKKEVDYPNKDKMELLVSTLILNKDLVKNMIGNETLNEITIKFGATLDSSDSFYTRPFLQYDNQIIVLNITALPLFLINYYLRQAKEYGEYDSVIRDYNDYCLYKCLINLRKMGHYRIDEKQLDIELSNLQNYKEVLLNMNDRGLLWVRFFCDDGTNYDFSDVHNSHQLDIINLEKRNECISELSSRLKLTKVYQMIITNNIARDISGNLGLIGNIKCIKLNPFDLMCVSINERNRTSFIAWYTDSRIRCLNEKCAMYTDLYNISTYVDNHYSFYFSDDFSIRDTLVMPNFSSAIDYINKALIREDRQLIEYPNSSILREVVKTDDIRNIYINTGDNNFEMLNRFVNVDIWTTIKFRKEDIDNPNDINIIQSIIDLITYWLAELKDVIENASFLYDSLEIIIVFSEKLNEYYQEQYLCDKSLEELIGFNVIENTITVTITPSAYLSFSAKDNAKEKEFICLLLSKMMELCIEAIDLCEVEKVFDDNPLKQKMYSLDYQKHPYFMPINTEVLVIPSECEEQVLDEIGDYFTMEKHMNPGNIPLDKRNDMCNQVVSFLYEKLCNTVKKYNYQKLLDIIYTDLETTIYSIMVSRVRYAYDYACYPESAEKLSQRFNELNKSSIALKFLIEYVSATQYCGNEELNNMDYETILAICSEIINWAHTSDLYKFNIINSDMNLLKSGRLGYDKTQIHSLTNLSFLANEQRLLSHSNPAIEKYSPSNLLSSAPDELNDAFSDEYSYSFSEFVTIVNSLLDIGEESSSELKKYEVQILIEKIRKTTNINLETIIRCLNDLSLKKRTDYLTPPKGFSKYDIWPWRFNRRLSFTRRPLILLGHTYIWGNRQLFHCLLFTVDLIYDGKLCSKSKKMKALLGKIANNRGNQFNDVVAEKLSDFDFLIVDSKVKKLNLKRLMDVNKKDLGDIDLLLLNKRKKHIVVCELKDFSLSKTPYEMYNEYLSLFCDTEEKACYITKHKKRVDWVKQHICDVLAHYGLQTDNWVVNDVLIVNEPIISNQYYHKKQNILLFSDINRTSIMKL